jgi:hypothetical protein
MKQVLMKRQHNAARLRGVTPQNTVIIIIIFLEVRSSEIIGFINKSLNYQAL